MRPKKLTVSAFGPFAAETVIDMEKLGTQGLYLISGITGAGKTTIFDAITYALFGEASGNNREASMLRSKYADADTPTFVKLIFDYAGKEYAVSRSPEYERPTKRGDGVTVQKAEAELFFQDGRIITKTKEVTATIKDIIGIDRKQFTQIAMIAQGDFMKLLLASTDERKMIFRQIFKTELYNNLQDKLKYELSDLNRQYDEYKKSIRQYINGVIFKEDDVLYLSLKKAIDDGLPMAETLELLKTAIEQDKNELSKAKTTSAELDKALERVNTQLGKAQEIEKAAKNLEQAQAELLELEPKLKKLLSNLESEEKKRPERDKLAEDITISKSKLPQYDELEKTQKLFAEKQTELANKNKEVQERKSQLKMLSAEVEKLKNEAATLKDTGTEKEKLENSIATITEKGRKLKALLESVSELEKTYGQYQEKINEYKTASETAESLKNDYDRKNKAFLDEQAGVLAQKLIDGEQCPVCGSTHHPFPAKLTQNAPTEAELKKAKEQYESAQENASRLSSECAALKGSVSAMLTEIKKQSEELIGSFNQKTIKEDIGTALKTLSGEISDQKKRLDAENKNILRKSALEKLIPEKDLNFKKLGEEIASIEIAAASLKSDISNLEKQSTQLSEKLEFDSKDKAEATIFALEKRKSEMQATLERMQNSHKECKSKEDSLKGTISALTIQLKSSEQIDINAATEEKATLENKKTAVATIISELSARINANGSAHKNIVMQSGNLDNVETKLKWVRALSNTANGTIGGKEKIMLETYIQMNFFDRIIAKANTRFMVMSGGQYELKRRIESGNNRSQSGLDLDVIDHYNGTERSVKSLSGGESFKASLSLALGLSDEIQSSAGGIQLDTMFVDEGFGSLDEESLQPALKALTELTQGNRLVGIISHVSLLKEKIDKQIIVNKNLSGGSSIKIVV